MKIQQFQGGKSSRLAPQFIQVNQGVVYENVDNSKGTLTPLKTTAASGTLLDKYQTYYDAAQEWVSSTTRRDYVEYSSDLYWTDRSTQPQKYNGTTQTNLGIAVPTAITNFTVLGTDSVAEVTFDPDTTGTGLPNQDTYYILVNVDGAEQSNALSAVVKDNGKAEFITTTGVASTAAALVLTAITSTRDITIENPVGFTIGANGVDVYRLYKGTYRLVGNLATDSSSLLDSTEDISANDALDTSLYYPLQGTYQYQLTYYNSADGSESGPSELSAELDLTAGGTVTLNNLPVSSDSQVDKKRLYRIGGDLTVSTLVVELDNSTTSYLDELKDTEVVGTLLDTALALPAPSDLAYLTEAYAMLFAAQGSKLRFTPIGKTDQWPELYFLQFDADITGIAAVTHGLLIYTKFKTFIVTGTGPTSLSQQVLTADQGCLAFESVQTISGAALWVSSDGICTSDGNEPLVISKDALGKLSLDVVDSVVYDEAYYALLSDQTALVFDFAYGKVFKNLSFGLESLVVGNDVLYGWSTGELQTLYASETNATMKYKSPRFIEGSVTELKTYKNVRVYAKGDIIIKTYIDDSLVATNVLTGELTHWIKVPQNLQRGYFIQFEIEGTGEVYEVEYITGDMHNA